MPTVSITPSVVSELAIVIVTLSEDGALDRLTVKVARTAVLIGIFGDLRNIETAFGRVIEVSHRNIGRIHIRKAKIRRVIVAGQLNRVGLVAVG